MNWQAYSEGQKAWDIYHQSGWKDKRSNPYPEDTEEWKSWNRGWNTNFNGIE